MSYPTAKDLEGTIGVWWTRRHDLKWGRVYIRAMIRADIERLRAKRLEEIDAVHITLYNKP